MKTQPNMVKKIINFIHFGSKEKQNKIEVQLQNKYKLKKMNEIFAINGGDWRQ